MGNRTPHLFHAMEALYQMSYIPAIYLSYQLQNLSQFILLNIAKFNRIKKLRLAGGIPPGEP